MKTVKNLLFNKISIFVLFCATLFTSCTDRETYVTSVSIKNSLSDSIEVRTYNKNSSENKSFIILKDEVGVIYQIEEKNIEPTEILNNKFDSINIYDKTSDLAIKFKPNNAYNYTENPYTNDFLWAISVTTSTKQSTFSKNIFLATNYILDIKSENVE